MKSVMALLCGLLFGVGLIVSGMTNPAKVIGFLDIFGTWDPTLAFVMGGALCVTALSYWLIFKRRMPLFAEHFALPTRNDIDRNLIVGATLFGIGWGLAGLCPGPAIVVIGSFTPEALLFVGAMIAGMLLSPYLTEKPATEPI